MLKDRDAKNLKTYIFLSYIIFWLSLAFTGAMIALDIPLLLLTILKNICAWTPTFVILIMFNRLYPDISFKEYLKINFTKRINPWMFLLSFLLQISIVAASIILIFAFRNKPLNTMTFVGISSILPIIIIDLTAGVTGEELGWRGYVLNILQKKYIPLTASLILGIIWGLWHLPLMILSGYANLELVYYMIAFMITVISMSVIITFFYNKSKNILIAMWLHFWFNFLLKIVIIDLLPLLMYLTIGYLLAAILIVVFNKNELISKQEQTSLAASSSEALS